MAIKIKQGDSYALPIKLKIDGDPLNPADAEEVEFVIGGLRKLYTGAKQDMGPNVVWYDLTDSTFMFPLTQDETFAWETGVIDMDIRIKFVGGDVEGIRRIVQIVIVDAISEEVI
jgi:hypothetical protein